VIGIVGYFTVPSVANYIIHAGGGYALLHKTSNMFTGGARTIMSTAAAASGAMIGSQAQANQAGASGDAANSDYMYIKLSGKPTPPPTTNH
jgi:hypothetical protein